jgi:hypothetical protein
MDLWICYIVIHMLQEIAKWCADDFEGGGAYEGNVLEIAQCACSVRGSGNRGSGKFRMLLSTV